MSSSQTSLDTNLLVKDLDGQFKVLQDGVLSSANNSPATITTPTVSSLPSSALPVAVPPDEHFLPAPQASVDPAARADFHFHPDDRQDIALEIEKITNYLSANERKKYSVEKIAEKLVEKNELKFSPEQYARFVKSLLSFFRQARSFVLMRALLSDTSSAGYGLDPAVADRIMLIARSLKEKIESVDGVVVEAGGERGQNTASTERVIDQPQVEIGLPDVPLVTPVVSVPITKPEVIQPKVEVAPEVPIVVPEPAVLEPPISPVQPTPISMRNVETDLPKVSRPISDVSAMVEQLPKVKRPGARVVGKVDELATMSLQDFRTLDPDPRMRVAKILQRIINLGKESLLRRAQGIDGWRKNEVYQHYLAIGNQSLEHGMDINQAISALQASGQSTLSLDEFEAVTDLNKHLRF